jgi:hypothetical protein
MQSADVGSTVRRKISYRYAAGTSVGAERSRAELERLLTRAGATQHLIGVDARNGFAFVVFGMSTDRGDRRVRVRIPLPNINDPKIAVDGRNHKRTDREREKMCDQIIRERWRVMVLLMKAKLEAIALGMSTLEREFLSDIFLPDGQTVGEAIEQQIADTYATGKMPPLLGA